MKILVLIMIILGQGLPNGGSFILERSPQMAYDIGVRSYLTGKGVPNASIDYDKNSGNVTINKQPFYKPELNMSGSTYSNQANLDNAYKTYSASQPQPTSQTGLTRVDPPQTGMSSISTNVPSNANTGYQNPYVSQYEDIMKRLDESNKALQQPVDIYSSPEYAAAKANQDKAAQQSTRKAQESMGASGFGRSTNLADRAQGIQNEANDYLQTQLVPQIQSALQNKNQQQYNNLLSQFNTIYSLVNQADSQHQNEVSNANADRTFEAGRQDAATAATGIYNPTGLSYEEVKAQMAKNSQAYGSATPEEQARLHDENIQLGASLGQTYDSKTGGYSKDQGFVGSKTIQAKQLDSQLSEVAYAHARDSLLDKRYEAEFNNNIKQQGFENALKIALQAHQISNDNAQLAISQQNANTSSASAGNSSSNARINQLMDAWKATGSAPAGLEGLGVNKGTPYAGQEVSPSAIEDKQNQQSEYVSGFDSLKPEQRKLAFKNDKATIIKDLGIAGYNALYSMYFDSSGYPLDEN